MQPVAPTPDPACPYVWTTYKDPLDVRWDASDLSRLITRHVAIKETEKTWRVECSYSAKGTVLRKDKYNFFLSEQAALEFIANEANKMAATLNERKLTYTRLLCDAHDALKDLTAK